MTVEGEEAERAAEELARERAQELGIAPAPNQAPSQQPRPSPKPPLPRPARAPLPAGFFIAISVLVSVGGLALWGALYTFALSSVQEHRNQRVLLAAFSGEAASGTAPTGGKIAQGLPVAVMDVPPIGLHHVMIVEGTSAADLEAGPGHRRDTPLPGEVGTSYILGRSRTFGAPFARIARLKKGDGITVNTGQGKFSFTVDAVRRPGDSLTPFDAGAARLTLVTSEPAKGGLRQILYVDATLKGTGQAASTGRPSRLPLNEDQLQADKRAVIPIILWLGATLLVVAALAWARTRWGLKPSMLVGLPVLVALAWGVAEAATHLLPNLY